MCRNSGVDIFSLCGVFNVADTHRKQIQSILKLFDELKIDLQVIILILINLLIIFVIIYNVLEPQVTPTNSPKSKDS